MDKMRSSFLREVSWDEVRLEVKKIAPDIFKRIEQLSPDKHHKLYEAAYPWGEMIIDQQGLFRVTDERGMLWPITAPNLSKKLVDELGYNDSSPPLGLVLEGQVQLYTENTSSKSISSHQVFSVGDLCALNRTLDQPNTYQVTKLWRMTSGVRTPCMIPSISDRIKFKKLDREFDLHMAPPEFQAEHWMLFKALANHPDFHGSWQSRILFFGKKWVLGPKTLPEESFSLALYKRAFKQSALLRNSFILDKFWERMVDSIRNKKVDRYIVLVARHILEGGFGKVLTYQVANGNVAGPFKEIAEVICDVYGLKKYAPIIMTPNYFDAARDKDTYVSLLWLSADLSRKRGLGAISLLSDLEEIAYVHKKFFLEYASDVSEEAPPYSTEHLTYRFYSADVKKGARKEGGNVILPANTAFDGNALLNSWKFGENKDVFQYNTFLRACIRISSAGDE